MSKSMNVVMIIPTGIGCEIGGHAGDATPTARLLGSVCDKLILHPNVVNASDINEMPENALYVEGSILDRVLEGTIELKEVKSNRILVVVNKPIRNETINAVSASRATLGIDARTVELETPLRMIGNITKEGAGGKVFGVDELVRQVEQYDFDALAIASLIEVPEEVEKNYWKNGGVNPWGGVEAVASREIAQQLNKPVAHSPILSEGDNEKFLLGEYNFVCDPRMSAEIISHCFLHCILKGLHKAPRICRAEDDRGLSVRDIDVMVSPECWGRPHNACWENGIPIVIVRENKTIYSNPFGTSSDRGGLLVENYLEAAGVIAAMKEGICLHSLWRPLLETDVDRIDDA